MIGWVIDRDYLNTPDSYFGDEDNRVGYGMTVKDAQDTLDSMIVRQLHVSTDMKVSDLDQPVRFRARDEDDEKHYGGAMSLEMLNDPEDVAYSLIEFCMNDTGATIVEFRVKDFPEGMAGKIGCLDKSGEWTMVYG